MQVGPFSADKDRSISKEMRLVVSIPTTGRRTIVGPTVRAMARQNRLPDLVVIVIAQENDLDPADLEGLPFEVRIEKSDIGLTRQRNRALDQLQAEDILLFLDDDFLMAPDYLERLESLFTDHPEIVMTTGTVIADGIHRPGITHDAGVAMLAALPETPRSSRLRRVYNGYGCNMAMRAAPIVAHALRFDPRLPFYGWLEDVDFSRQLAPFGRIVRAEALRGVHLGTKTGRSSGLRLGYSQIANPLYLWTKRTMRVDLAGLIMLRNLIMNVVRTPWPEPEVDRLGRLRGNLRAFGDLITGRLRPERVQDMG